MREVSEVVPDFGARSAQVICLSWGANYLIFGGRYAVADEFMSIIGELAGDLSEIDLQAVGAGASGAIGARLDRRAISAPASAGSRPRCWRSSRRGDLRNACAIRSNMGYVYCELGDFERAEVALRHALAAADRMGLRELTAAVLHNLGRVLGLRGNLDEARRLERRAIDSFVEQGEPRLEGVARTYLAEILIAAGEFGARRTGGARRGRDADRGAVAARGGAGRPGARAAGAGTAGRAGAGDGARGGSRRSRRWARSRRASRCLGGGRGPGRLLARRGTCGEPRGGSVS